MKRLCAQEETDLRLDAKPLTSGHNARTKSHVHRESEYKDILWPDISLAC